MKKIVLSTLLTWLALAAGAAAENPRVVLETSKGSIVIELFENEAPQTVSSFLENVESGFYDQTIFHRVIKKFMIQGGGFTSGGQLKPTSKLVENEADNGLKNTRGTVAMARKGDPDSASVQFFINHADNAFLDHKAKTPRGWGYAVFGRVVEGMDVVDAIAEVPVRRSQLSEAQPLEPVLIEKASVLASASSGG